MRLCQNLMVVVVLLATSTTASSHFVLHEKRSNIDSRNNWKKSPVADLDAFIPVRIGLTQRNLDQGYRHVMDVSHPDSNNYGKHWTPEQVEAEFSPSPASVQLVKSWLADAGIDDSLEQAKGWLAFNASIAQAQKLLQATFMEYENPSDGTVRLGCDEYSLPPHISPHVDYITPAIKLSPPVELRRVPRAQLKNVPREVSTSAAAFGSAKLPAFDQNWTPPASARNLPADIQNCGFNITPPCLRALYGLPRPPNKIASNRLGIFEYDNPYLQADLDLYFKNYAPYVPNGTHPHIVSVNGANGSTTTLLETGKEANIDIILAYAVLGATNVTLFATDFPQNNASGDRNIFEPFFDAIDGSFCTQEDKDKGLQCGTASLTQVVSLSYILPELTWLSAAQQQRTCNELMKLSLQGHTFVFSSGDYGVASNPGLLEPFCYNDGCAPRDLNNTGPNTYNDTIFNPGFPASCPYALAVGATMLYPNQTVRDPESAMDIPGYGGCLVNARFASAGGFSNYFSRPSYQSDAVSTYLDKYVPNYKYYTSNGVDASSKNTTIGTNNGIYNHAGRGIPDVSANGANLIAYAQTNVGNSSGTSLSAPIWASIIAMINEKRANVGKGPVGFINPTLYKHTEVFNDIKNGSNPGCSTPGFHAVPGWDPVTGLGTPKYDALEALFLRLP